MKPTSDENQTVIVVEEPEEQGRQQAGAYSEDLQLRRWLVSFDSGSGSYPVGEFVALDATAAIGRAVEIFGPAVGHRAEEIPWDAAPLPRVNRSSPR